jgi:hypothetical protein
MMSFFTVAVLIAFDEIAYTLGTSEKMRRFTHPDSGRFWLVDPALGKRPRLPGRMGVDPVARYHAAHFVPSDARNEFD